MYLRKREQGGIPWWVWLVIGVPLLGMVLAFCGGLAAALLVARERSSCRRSRSCGCQPHHNPMENSNRIPPCVPTKGATLSARLHLNSLPDPRHHLG